jgi:hypothetical protein
MAISKRIVAIWIIATVVVMSSIVIYERAEIWKRRLHAAFAIGGSDEDR